MWLRFRKTVLTAILLALSLVPAAAQVRSEREERNYLGPVKSVRVESVKVIVENNRQKLSPRRLESSEQFDEVGNLLENVDYEDDGTVSYSETNSFIRGRLAGTKVSYGTTEDGLSQRVFVFDARGNVIEETEYDPKGAIFDRAVSEYNSRNQLTQKTTYSYYDPERVQVRRTTYTYDAQGRMTERRLFEGTGEEFQPVDDRWGEHRKVLLYAGGNHWIGSRTYNAKNELVESWTTARDACGNELETIQYDGEQKVKTRVRYEYGFDHQGNWIEQRTYDWDLEKEKFGFAAVEFRTIEYFAPKIPAPAARSS